MYDFHRYLVKSGVIMKIAVIGGGSWGTALALVAHRANNEVTLFLRNKNICEQINQSHVNYDYLPNIKIPEDIIASSDLSSVLDSDVILLSIPAQIISAMCHELVKLGIKKDKILVVCAKGIDQSSLSLMSEIVQEIMPDNHVAVLSGPNFAKEVAKDLPAITSIACSDTELGKQLVINLSSKNFRIYLNDDIVGTQILGAAKNVLAIATGIAIGKNLGENAKSAVISRGICEIMDLVLAKHGKMETLLSPAGIADINLTCNSEASRNTAYGISLANENYLASNNLVEGFYTAKSIVSLAKKLNVEMPICEAVYDIIYNKKKVDYLIDHLLNRSIKN